MPQVYTQFAEAAGGAPTIRAFDQQARFTAINEELVASTQRASIAGTLHAFQSLLLCLSSVRLLSHASGCLGVAAAQWLALRLQSMAAVVVFVVALLAVLDTENLLPSRSHQRPVRVGAASMFQLMPVHRFVLFWQGR